MANTLDFVGIGAAKSATTTIHQMLSGHPQLALPVTKEAPFFSDDREFRKGLEYYLRAQFPDADPAARWGSITPHYLLGDENIDVIGIADRMRTCVPDTKIFAVLRHPVERTFSHYKMQLVRGYESRPFDEVVPWALDQLERHGYGPVPNEDRFRYFGASEYGRLLQIYFDRFPAEHIRVLTTDALRSDAAGQVAALCAFLGVDDDYRPTDAAVRARQGGSRPKVRALTPGRIYRIPGVRYAWKNWVPSAVRNRVEYRTNLWNMRPDDERIDRSSVAWKTLVDYYADDVRHLEQLLGHEVPWTDWHRSSCG